MTAAEKRCLSSTSAVFSPSVQPLEYKKELKPIAEGQKITDVVSSRSAAFIKSIFAHNLGRLRWLRLNFLGCELRLMLYPDDHKDPVVIETPYRVDLECDRDQAKHERRERMVSEVRVIALDVAAREGPLKLRGGGGARTAV